MGKTARSTLDGALLGMIGGMAGRTAYDRYNEEKMVKDYQREGVVPERKSMFIALALTFFFGSLGLMYSSKKVGIFTFFIEGFLFISMLMPFLIFMVIPLFFLRLILVGLAFLSVISHNDMKRKLFGRFTN